MTTGPCRFLRTVVALLAGACACLPQPSSLLAQPPSQTTVEVIILTPSIGVDPLQAQRWRSVLQEVGANAQLKQPLSIDKVEITQQQRGTLRTVKAVGRLNADGTVTFPNKQFTQSQGRDLAAWVEELKLYGAQGSPAGQPRHGLSEGQHQQLIQQLGQPVAQSTRDVTFAEALRRIPLPDTLPLVFDDSIADEQVEFGAAKFSEELEGLAAGTSLAFLLSQRKLAFRPLRTPSGSIQLRVEKLEGLDSPWPIGGAVTDTVSRDQIYPRLFEIVETGVANSTLPVVLDAVEQKSGTRILVDRAGCLARDVKMDELIVNQPPKKTAWALIVKNVVGSFNLQLRFQQDEAGKGFLLVSPFQSLK